MKLINNFSDPFFKTNDYYCRWKLNEPLEILYIVYMTKIGNYKKRLFLNQAIKQIIISQDIL